MQKKLGKSKFYKLAMWASPNFILLNLCDILIRGNCSKPMVLKIDAIKKPKNGLAIGFMV